MKTITMSTIEKKKEKSYSKIKKYVNSTCFLLIFLFLSSSLQAQSLLNGSFEDYTLEYDTSNIINNTDFNVIMPNCYSFGWQPNIEIYKTPWCSNVGAQDGKWYLGVMAAGWDRFSMKISQPLIPGHIYSLSFYEKYCNLSSWYTPYSLLIGLSVDSLSFGSLVFTGPVITTLDTTWVNVLFSFVAPNNGCYITVKGDSLNPNPNTGYLNIDNFELTNPTEVQKQESNNNVLIYPNPFTNKIELTGTETINKIIIYSFFGTRVCALKPVYGTSSVNVDLSYLPVGIYWAEIFCKDYCIKQKIVKIE